MFYGNTLMFERKLADFAQSKNVPHIILYGHSVDKHQILETFLVGIYGCPTTYKKNTLSLNCFFPIIHDDLKLFIKTNSFGVPFKSVVLYNAEHLANDTQSMLRRLIELYSHTTRFFIVLENKNKLLKPILSRFYHICTTKLNSTSILVKDGFHLSVDLASVPNSFVELTEYVNTIYEQGITTEQLVQQLSTQPENLHVCMMYHKIKSLYRNEQQLMYTILFYHKTRSNIDFKNISLL